MIQACIAPAKDKSRALCAARNLLFFFIALILLLFLLSCSEKPTSNQQETFTYPLTTLNRWFYRQSITIDSFGTIIDSFTCVGTVTDTFTVPIHEYQFHVFFNRLFPPTPPGELNPPLFNGSYAVNTNGDCIKYIDSIQSRIITATLMSGKPFVGKTWIDSIPIKSDSGQPTGNYTCCFRKITSKVTLNIDYGRIDDCWQVTSYTDLSMNNLFYIQYFKSGIGLVYHTHSYSSSGNTTTVAIQLRSFSGQ
ncbi:MAG: hypothetical protein V1913_09100 [Fibrobacterota bacterium]